MARILIAWELGSGLGHALPLRMLADRLHADGHQVFVAARDLLTLRRVFADSVHALLPLPFFPGLLLPPRQLNALSDVIWFEAGGHAADAVAVQFAAWRGLLRALAPDLMVTDAAPMTLAATQGLLPRLNYDGYFHATDARAWSTFRDWERADTDATAQRSIQLLANVNAARDAVGRAASADLASAFVADAQVLRCMPELDPFGPRADTTYVGQASAGGASPHWPASAGSRVFVYLRSGYAHSERLLGALIRQSGLSVLAVVAESEIARLPRAAHIAYTSTAIDLNLALPASDLVVCHGGALQGLAIQAGKPSLLMPLHTEHFLSARIAERLGTSLVVMPPLTSVDFLSPLRRLLAEPVFTQRAAQLAELQRTRMPDPLGAVAAQIDRLLQR